MYCRRAELLLTDVRDAIPETVTSVNIMTRNEVKVAGVEINPSTGTGSTGAAERRIAKRMAHKTIFSFFLAASDCTFRGS